LTLRGERRSTNKIHALALAKIGVAVFPSSGKVPLIPRFNKLDTEITPEDREAAIEKFREDHDGEAPIHVGSTKDPEVIKRMWRAHRDAVPSVACGPSRLVVLDADQKDNGPELMDALFKENGGVPAGVAVLPTKSGGKHYVFADPDGSFTNKAGLLKKNYGTDVRGTGGQFVAPGSIREDNRSYGTRADLAAFCRAITSKQLPQLPTFITELIGASGAETGTSLSETDSDYLAALNDIESGERDDYVSLFDATVGTYPLDSIFELRPDFKSFYETPGSDRSANRLKVATFLVGAYPNLSAADYAVFSDEHDWMGEPSNRELAKEYTLAKHSPANVSKQNDGEAFGAADKDGKPLPFEFESDVAANATLPDWLIGEIIEAETLCVIYGAPNSGKSLAVLDMLYHVATGKPWRGRDVKRGSVLYISVEGPNGTARRAKAWREHYGVADGERLPLAFIRVDVDLFNDKKSAQAIVDAVALLESVTGLPCRAVAIDTVNAVTPGMDENSTADMGIFLRNLRTILAETSAAVLPVHHTGKDATRGLRGSNTLLAKAETTLLVSDGVLSTVKMRDGRRGQESPFAIKILNLWTDDKGRPVGAPVVIEPEIGTSLRATTDDDDESVPLPSDTPEDKLAATLRALESCVVEQAEVTGDPITEIGVTRGNVFARLNRDRQSAGLPGLKEPTIVTRLLDKLVKSRQAICVGANRRTEYRLAA
jgi:hypothetical protein